MVKNDLSVEIKSIGEFILFHRERKNLSIQDLSSITKIRVKQLNHLEQNNFKALPSKVYIIGFLKTLSRVLEFDLALAIDILDQHHFNEEALQPVPKHKEDISFSISLKSYWPWYKAVVMVVLVFVVTVYSLTRSKQEERVTTKVPPAVKVAPKVKVENLISEKEKHIELVDLELKAIKGDSWLAYKIDQQKIVRYTLKKGQSLVLKGEKIRITLGNPQAVELTKSGQIVAIEKNLVFPEHLSSIYKPPFFVFDDQSGAVITKRMHEENQQRYSNETQI